MALSRVHGFANLLGATMLAGVFLLAMGLARMGQLIRFIPVTVVIGFTNGIAVVIFLAQIKDFFGLKIDNLPAEFFHRIKTLAAYAHTVDLPTLGLASACFVFLLSYNKLSQKIAILRRAPGPLVVLIVGTLVFLPVRSTGRDHRQPLPRHSARAAPLRPARPVDPRFRQADLTGHHHRPARCYRVATLGSRCRQPDR